MPTRVKTKARGGALLKLLTELDGVQSSDFIIVSGTMLRGLLDSLPADVTATYLNKFRGVEDDAFACWMKEQRLALGLTKSALAICLRKEGVRIHQPDLSLIENNSKPGTFSPGRKLQIRAAMERLVGKHSS